MSANFEYKNNILSIGVAILPDMFDSRSRMRETPVRERILEKY